jgi:hypothetical protein
VASSSRIAIPLRGRARAPRSTSADVASPNLYAVSNHDRVGERSERLWHVEGSRDRSDKLTELLIDCEEDRTLRAVLVGMLREAR